MIASLTVSSSSARTRPEALERCAWASYGLVHIDGLPAAKLLVHCAKVYLLIKA